MTADINISLEGRHPSSRRFVEVIHEAVALHDLKQKDYGTDADPFHNVRASAEWSMPEWVGGMVRATDKVRRLQTYAKTGELSNESARDAFLDLANYALISLVLWEEQQAHRHLVEVLEGEA